MRAPVWYVARAPPRPRAVPPAPFPAARPAAIRQLKERFAHGLAREPGGMRAIVDLLDVQPISAAHNPTKEATRL